jgi:beta-lactamase superfamily II metal-dependent hydrolase
MRSRLLSLPTRAVLLGVFLPSLALAQPLRFTTLDIGQGDAAVLIAPGGCAALFDGGPTGSGTAIKSYLRSLGVTRLDMAFTSHFHADHLGGLDEVDTGTNAVPITRVYDRGGSYSSSPFTEYASRFSGRRSTVSVGQTFSLCNQVTLRVVAVNGNGTGSADENALSVVVKISYRDFDALVGGDLTGTGGDNVESVIASSVGELELYKVHHHGSRYSSNTPFLDATQPTVAFISVGRDNSYGHPTPECLSRLAAHGSAVWQTEDPENGTVRGHIALTSDGLSFSVAQDGQLVTYPCKGGSPGDPQPPTAPAALVANATSPRDIALSWTASTDNVGVTGYNVYRSADGGAFTLLANTGDTSHTDTGLSAGATYGYQVTALDAASNESLPSPVAVATTPIPAVTLTSPNGGESWAAGSSRNITWTSSYVSSVALEYTTNNGSSWTLISGSVAASTGSYAWTVPGTATTSARVRISNAQGGDPSDTSNGVFTITAGTPARVVINEILANEEGSDTGGEAVELVNVGGTAISIAGWTLQDGSSVRHTFAAGTTLQPGKAIAVFASASAIPGGLTNAVAASTGALSLNNTGDTVSVRNGATTVDTFTYSSTLAGTDGVSMNRSPDATATGTFVLHTNLSTLSASPGTRASGAAF